MVEEAIRKAAKHDLKHGSNDRAKSVFQLLQVVNILAWLLLKVSSPRWKQQIRCKARGWLGVDE